MADRTIGDLPVASELLTTDLIPIQQGGSAKSISGQLLASYAREKAEQAASEAEGYAEDAADSAEEAAAWSSNPPYIGQNGNWWIYNTTTEQFVDSGVDASITVDIADITEIAAGSTPYVTNTGTATDPVFHLFIPAANSIVSIAKTSSVGLTDTYTITFADGTTTTFSVENGADGNDGFSPVVSISTTTGGHTVTITDATHPSGQSFTVQDGDDGVSPSVTVTSIAGGHRVSITDATGTQTFDVLDGTGSGDMLVSVYDPDGDVATAGGIADYVDDQLSQLVTGVSSFNGRTGAVVPASGDYTAAMVTGAEATANRVTTITSSSTDATYPTALAVYNLFNSITNLNGVSF